MSTRDKWVRTWLLVGSLCLEKYVEKGWSRFYNITKFTSAQSSSGQVLSISRAQRNVCLFLKAIKAHVITSAWICDRRWGVKHLELEHGCWWHADLHTWRHQTQAPCGQADHDPSMPPQSTCWSGRPPGSHLHLPKLTTDSVTPMLCSQP